MTDDAELMSICAKINTIDDRLIKNDQFICGEREDIQNDSDAMVHLIDALAKLSPATDEGARAQAFVLLRIIRVLDDFDAPECILRLMQRVVSRAAGIPEMGDIMQPFNSALGPRFNLAVKMMVLS